MNKISIKSFLFENGLISELDSSWKNDFLTGAKGMPKTSEDVLDYLQDIYFTGFGGEQNVKAINKKMARWAIQQIDKLGGPQNIGTNDREKLITVMTWLKIAGSEGQMPTMDLNTAYDFSNKKIEEKGKKEAGQKGAEEFPEPPITKVEEEGLVKRVYTIPDGSGRVWVKVDTQRAGEFFDKLCDANKAYGVGCQSIHSGMMHIQHRAANRTTYTLLGPEKGKKVPITTLMSLSIDTASKNMIEAKQVGNQEVGTNLYGWDDLFEQFVNFLGTPTAKQTIDSTTDAYALAWAFRNKRFDLINRLDLIRPDFITNSKRVILSSDGGKEWFETRSLDAVEALGKFGPESFIEKIEGYTKSASFKEALEQLKEFLPKLSEKNPNLILSKIDLLLDILPAEDFGKIIANVGLGNYIKNNKDGFEKLLKKLITTTSPDKKTYKNIFNSILENHATDIAESFGGGIVGFKNFIEFLKMPKSDKHKFIGKNSEGKSLAIRKEVKREGGVETSKDVTFTLNDQETLMTQKERRNFIEKNEDLIKSLYKGDNEDRKDVNFLRLKFGETNIEEIKRNFKELEERNKFINYYNNLNIKETERINNRIKEIAQREANNKQMSVVDYMTKHKSEFQKIPEILDLSKLRNAYSVSGVPIPGIISYYDILSNGRSGSKVEGDLSTYKIGKEDFQDKEIFNKLKEFFGKVRAVKQKIEDKKLLRPTNPTTINIGVIEEILKNLKASGYSDESMYEFIKTNFSNELESIITNSPSSFFDTLSKIISNNFVKQQLFKDKENIISKIGNLEFEKIINDLSEKAYNVKVEDMVEFLGTSSTGYDERDKLIKKRISLAYLFMGRKYKIVDVDNNAEDRNGVKNAKIKVLDNQGKKTDWMNTDDFKVNITALNESDIRKYVGKKLLESYKKMKK